MDIPESMRSELGAWNNGGGIDLEGWVGCEGSFALAVGYLTLFWPEFVEFEGISYGEGFLLRVCAALSVTRKVRGTLWSG